MSEQWILRLTRSDPADEPFVLVNIFRKGTHPLDINIIATEGQDSYTASISQSQCHTLRALNYSGSTSEWEAVLSNTLLQEAIPASLARDLDGLECDATVSPQTTISIVWRRKISGISQRLGALELKVSNTEEFDLWGACALGALKTGEIRKHVDELEVQLSEQKTTTKKLQDQLQSLTKAKEEHENALLQKFSELLNTKKAKIREQQRLLSTAKVDPAALERVESIKSPRTRTAGPSRMSKRKAGAHADPESSADSSDGFEDVPKEGGDDEMGGLHTPDRTDDETEDEEVGVLVVEPMPKPSPKRGLKRGIGGRGKAAAKGESKELDSGLPHRGKGKELNEEMELDGQNVPPPCDLSSVFGKRKAAEVASQKIGEEASNSKITPQPNPAEEDDEDTDDEL